MGKNFSPVQTLFPWDFFPAWIAGTLWGEMTEVRCLLWVFPHAPRNAGIAAAPASSHQGSRGPFSSGRDGCGMRDLGCGMRDLGLGTSPGLCRLPLRCCWALPGIPFSPKKLFFGVCAPASSRQDAPARALLRGLEHRPSAVSRPVPRPLSPPAPQGEPFGVGWWLWRALLGWVSGSGQAMPRAGRGDPLVLDTAIRVSVATGDSRLAGAEGKEGRSEGRRKAQGNF